MLVPFLCFPKYAFVATAGFLLASNLGNHVFLEQLDWGESGTTNTSCNFFTLTIDRVAPELL